MVELEFYEELIHPQINFVILKSQFDVDCENHMPQCPLLGQKKLFAFIYELQAKLNKSVAIRFIFEQQPSNFHRMIVSTQEAYLPIFIKIGHILFFLMNFLMLFQCGL